MKFQTNYDRDWHSKPEENFGPVLVETAGYLPMDRLIKLMMEEGKELADARQEMFDFPELEKVDTEQPLDPTRSPGFDMADGSMLERDVGFRIKEQSEKEKARIAKLAAEKEVEAEKAARTRAEVEKTGKREA